MRQILFGLLILVSLALNATGQDNEDCLSCHTDRELTGSNRLGAEISMFISEGSIDSSVHRGMSCVACHIDLEGFDDYPHAEELAPVDCSSCHDEISEIYEGSVHGQAVATNASAPTCATCHGTHKILVHTDPEAATSSEKLPYTCSSCHRQMVLNNDPDIKVADSFDRYMRGIHARGLAWGIGSAASCNDCHNVHDLKKASDPDSKVNKMNIPETCAKCHNDIFVKYSRGIHGKALAAGILDSPNCTDCHGEHEILEIDNPDSPVNASNISDYVCGKCHNDPRIVKKYGLKEGKFSSYQDSYHGLAVKGGSVKAANCISCHKAHDILPSTNPASSTHINNLVHTCQKCHPRANEVFAASYTHEATQAESNKLNTIVTYIYVVAIILIIGGMLAHNLIILCRYIIEKHRYSKTQSTVERFSKTMVYQHMVLTITFIVLVITGFALRYPSAWWVGILNVLGMYEDARSTIHRIAAVLLTYISIHHVIFLLLTRRGREELKAITPRKSDLTEAAHNIKFYLGKSKTRPRFDRYDYTEKAEYWAVVWGTVLMALTGAILWFPTFFTGFLPAWTIKIAETIHFYEAWLATLAIVVFHFFFVIFHPDQYPMSMTWLTGKMTMESCEHHHPKWHDRIIEKQAEDEAEKNKQSADNEEPPPQLNK